MLRLSKIWLENEQIKLKRPSPHFIVTRDIKMLKLLCTACLHHIRTRQKSLHLDIISTCLQNGTCMIEQSRLCLNHIVLYGVKDNT